MKLSGNLAQSPFVPNLDRFVEQLTQYTDKRVESYYDHDAAREQETFKSDFAGWELEGWYEPDVEAVYMRIQPTTDGNPNETVGNFLFRIQIWGGKLLLNKNIWAEWHPNFDGDSTGFAYANDVLNALYKIMELRK